ncbi:hypothetical protein CJO92_17065 (plasmid) [Ralstonia solanacearum]|uniref:Uncharacterized protein n=1 Tax=Ralstonia solanacearum TaxID=305 RepID=A0AAD0WHR8_RALSL|nr:hypothetical protein CJO77_17060 [Ralstonia solanacearum]AXW54464.1 hypothetical protein CJO92_17065 [Ralstonia solanacearum]
MNVGANDETKSIATSCAAPPPHNPNQTMARYNVNSIDGHQDSTSFIVDYVATMMTREVYGALSQPFSMNL